MKGILDPLSRDDRLDESISSAFIWIEVHEYGYRNNSSVIAAAPAGSAGLSSE